MVEADSTAELDAPPIVNLPAAADFVGTVDIRTVTVRVPTPAAAHLTTRHNAMAMEKDTAVIMDVVATAATSKGNDPNIQNTIVQNGGAYLLRRFAIQMNLG